VCANVILMWKLVCANVILMWKLVCSNVKYTKLRRGLTVRKIRGGVGAVFEVSNFAFRVECMPIGDSDDGCWGPVCAKIVHK
jgi:hypothetical protein